VATTTAQRVDGCCSFDASSHATLPKARLSASPEANGAVTYVNDTEGDAPCQGTAAPTRTCLPTTNRSAHASEKSWTTLSVVSTFGVIVAQQKPRPCANTHGGATLATSKPPCLSSYSLQNNRTSSAKSTPWGDKLRDGRQRLARYGKDRSAPLIHMSWRGRVPGVPGFQCMAYQAELEPAASNSGEIG
jgi:hypothetical protein